MIESYSQLPIVFVCKSKVNDKQVIWTKQYSLNNEDIKAEVESFNYSAVFEFQNEEHDGLVVSLQSKCICPTIKFPASQIIQFGQCPVNAEKQILFQINNKNKELPIQIKFPIIPYFNVQPS